MFGRTLAQSKVLNQREEHSMSQQISNNIASDPRFLKFVAKRNSYSVIMTILGAVAYYGFILLVAFNKEFLGQKMGAGVTTIGVPIGVA